MEDEIQVQKYCLQPTACPQQHQTTYQTTSNSQHTHTYLQFFQPLSQQLQLQQLINKINAKQILYKHDYFEAQLQARILKNDKNFNIVVFKISYGYFQLEVSTIRSQCKSCLHSPTLKSMGSKESTIFFIQYQRNKYVAKCFSINQKKKKIDVLADVIREYSLLKIASVLGIAPPLCTIFGFDLFINQNCIEFLYSQCHNIKHCAPIINKQQIQNLKLKLRTLHAFKIIHVDIKPDNIMYCPIRKKLVLIDFGFSRVIEEEVGFKTMTTFAGTMSYCSPEMTAISGQEPSFIDLYYNDLYGLQAFLNDLQIYKQELLFNDLEQISPSSVRTKKIEEIYNVLTNQDEYSSIIKKLMIFRLKYEIFCRNQQILKKKQFQQLILNNVAQVLQYIAQQNLTKTTEKIYEFIVSNTSYPSTYFHSFLNIQQAKQHQINQLGKSGDQNFKTFQQVFGLKDQESMEYELGENIPIMLTLKDRGPNTLQYKNKSAHRIICEFCRLVDILCCNTTLQQKIKLSQQFILHFAINQSQYKLNSLYPSLQLCLRYTLQTLISIFVPYSQDIIPQIISNLVIIQAFQPQQLVDKIRQIVRMDCPTSKYLKMLYKLRSIIAWNIYKIEFTIKYEYVTGQILNKIYNTLLDFAVNNNNKIIRFVVMIILLDQRRSLPQNQIKQMAQEIQDLDTGDSQFNNLLKTHFFIWRMQNQQQSIFFYQFLRIIYQINEINRQLIFHPRKINHFHIELFQLFQTSGDNYILTNIYNRLQKCFEGTQILKKYRLYYTYRPQILKYKDIRTQLHCLQEQDVDKIVKLSYQVLYEYNQILRQIRQLKEEEIKMSLIDRVGKVFNQSLLQKIVLPQEQQHKVKEFIVSNVLIAKIYISLYQPHSPQILSILKHIDKLQQFQSTLSCLDCKLKGTFLLLQIKWRVSRHLHNYQQAINHLIEHIKILTQNKVIQNQDLKFIFYDIRKIIEFFTELKLYTLQELKTSTSIEFVCRTIKEYKLHIYGLSHSQGLSVFSFQCWYTLVINSQLQYFFQLNNEILSLIYQYPDKSYVSNYQSYFQKFIKEYESWWEHTAPTVILYLFTNIKTIGCNSLICLFLALFLKFCHPKQDFFGKMKYYICKDIDLIDVRARSITLYHFFTYFLLQNGSMLNRRQRRYKIRKFASYIRREDFSLQEFERKMSISRQLKEQRCVFGKKMRIYFGKFHNKINNK